MVEQPVLLERAAESAALAAALGNLRGGQGGLVVVDGPHGIGKTTLLRHLRGLADPARIPVLHAQGRELERDFSLGVVRQLFERWSVTAPEAERRAAFAGAAKLAEPVFEYVPDPPGGGVLHATLHGLYWLCANLAAARPLVLVVDDLQWADRGSLQFLGYLAGRLEEHPLLVVVAYGGDEGPGDDVLAAIAAAPQARVLRPAPLSEQAVQRLAVRAWRAEPAPEFVRTCLAQTGGNPHLLGELIAEARRVGLRPTADAAGALRALVPPTIAQSVLRRLRRLPVPCRRLAHAVAVLDAGAELRVCAQVAGLDEPTATTAAELLTEAGLLRGGRTPAFPGPLYGTAVYEDLPAQARELAHARAAVALRAGDAPLEQVAGQLVRTAPGADPGTVAVLREAAAAALAGARPRPAADYLRRALAECGDGGPRAEVLAELGSAELRRHELAAVRHLSRALEATTDPRRRAAVGLELSVALSAADCADQAEELLRRLAADGGEPALRLDAQRVVAGRLWGPIRPGGTDLARLDRQARRSGGTGQPSVRAAAVLDRLPRSRTGPEVVGLADEVVAGDRLLGEDDAAVPPALLGGWLLATADRVTEAERLLARATRQAELRGMLLAGAELAALRALVLVDAGRLAEAEAAAAAVLGDGPVAGELWGPGRAVAFAAQLLVLLERDEPDLAGRRLAAAGMDGDVPEAMFFGGVLLARGRLRLARRQVKDGLADLLEYRRRCQLRSPLPAFPSAVPYVAVALTRLGRRKEACALTAEEVLRARLFGAPRPLAAALRSAGLVVGGAEGLRLLEESVRVAASSDSLLERTHGLVDQGAALRREGRRTDARRVLRGGIALAERCGAVALRKNAYSELVIAGGRVRRKGRGDVRSLTPSERRVAEMAATGMRNREIARELFVTVKTVEWHLSQVYPKLGISNRAELRDALTAG